jgi:putative transcriptional regulator
MTSIDLSLDLVGKCLIAMPDMPDARFQSSVIFICAHSAEGAMGLIVNKCVQDVKLADLMDQRSIPQESAREDLCCIAPIIALNCPVWTRATGLR